MWDAIFADDPSLEIVDLICLNMLLRLHWERKQLPPITRAVWDNEAD